MEEENLKPEEQANEIETEDEMEASLVAATQEIPEIWGATTKRQTSIANKHRANIQRSRGLLGTKHGMYSGVPMICKGLDCPFIETCWIDPQDLVVGERCPIEIATIMEQYENYCRELKIEPNETVDQGLVKQMIDLEVMMLRADKKMASSPDLLREVVDTVNQRTGDVYWKTEIDPVLQLKSDLRKEHHRILNLLSSTRKDKKDTILGRQDPSSMAANLLQRFRQMENEGKIVDGEIIEVTPSTPIGEENV